MIHEYLVQNHNINQEFEKKLDTKFVIIAPDEGALKRVQVYANKFKMSFMVVSKERYYSQVNKVERQVLIGDKKYLQGSITHGILSDPVIERINNTEYLKEVLVSDSSPQEEKLNKCSKLKTFSIVPILAEVINKLCKGGSLSEIFEI